MVTVVIGVRKFNTQTSSFHFHVVFFCQQKGQSHIHVSRLELEAINQQYTASTYKWSYGCIALHLFRIQSIYGKRVEKTRMSIYQAYLNTIHCFKTRKIHYYNDTCMYIVCALILLLGHKFMHQKSCTLVPL